MWFDKNSGRPKQNGGTCTEQLSKNYLTHTRERTRAVRSQYGHRCFPQIVIARWMQGNHSQEQTCTQPNTQEQVNPHHTQSGTHISPEDNQELLPRASFRVRTLRYGRPGTGGYGNTWCILNRRDRLWTQAQVLYRCFARSAKSPT
jgi:hypothetical protein